MSLLLIVSEPADFLARFYSSRGINELEMQLLRDNGLISPEPRFRHRV